MKLTYEAILNDHQLLSRVLQDARRERALAVHRLLIAPILALFARPPLRRSRMLRRIAYC
jgi:hypothetical protein